LLSKGIQHSAWLRQPAVGSSPQPSWPKSSGLPVLNPLSPPVAALADQGIRWVAITWVNHAGAPLVKVVPLAAFDAAAAVGVGFSPVSDAFRADGAIDPAHIRPAPSAEIPTLI
jgi:hypothetical protein